MEIPPATIGIFDSGVGGLSVLRHIREVLPGERLIYVADSGHAPYGDKSPEYIEQRSLAITRFLMQQGADAIVITCNTATAVAATVLRRQFSLPIVAMEPAVKPAVAATRSGVVGVLATVGTLESARFAALLEKYAGEVDIVTQGCPGLVEQIEQGDLDGARTRELVERYTAPLLARGADTLILGCTHYPFLTPLIRNVAGEHITLVDTGPAVAHQLQKRIQAELSGFRQSCISTMPGYSYCERAVEFWSSGEIVQSTFAISKLWGNEVPVRQLPV